MGRQHQQRGTMGKKSTLTERNRHTLRRTASKNHRTTAAQVTVELNIHIEHHFHKNCPT
jgi:hypothetical protein